MSRYVCVCLQLVEHTHLEMALLCPGGIFALYSRRPLLSSLSLCCSAVYKWLYIWDPSLSVTSISLLLSLSHTKIEVKFFFVKKLRQKGKINEKTPSGKKGRDNPVLFHFLWVCLIFSVGYSLNGKALLCMDQSWNYEPSDSNMPDILSQRSLAMLRTSSTNVPHSISRIGKGWKLVSRRMHSLLYTDLLETDYAQIGPVSRYLSSHSEKTSMSDPFIQFRAGSYLWPRHQ